MVDFWLMAMTERNISQNANLSLHRRQNLEDKNCNLVEIISKSICVYNSQIYSNVQCLSCPAGELSLGYVFSCFFQLKNRDAF